MSGDAFLEQRLLTQVAVEVSPGDMRTLRCELWARTDVEEKHLPRKAVETDDILWDSLDFLKVLQRKDQQRSRWLERILHPNWHAMLKVLLPVS